MLACTVLAVIACLFVSLSDLRRHCTKIAKQRIKQVTSYDSPGILVFWCQRSRRNSNGVIPTGAQDGGGVGYNLGDFRPIPCHISEMVEYYETLIGTCMRSIEWCYFQWPWVTLTTPNHPIFDILCRLSQWLEIETSNFVGGLTVASASPRMANHPWKGLG